MATRSLFSSRSVQTPPTAANTVNQAGGTAYALHPKSALVQYACTGTLGGSYYMNAETELHNLLDLCAVVSDSRFVAKTAVYARKHGYMKDAPSALLCALVGRTVQWESQQEANRCFEAAFGSVVDNGRMLRNIVQMLRSGKFGRTSLGTLPRRMIAQWILNASPWQLWTASVGNDPSLRDVLRLVRPKPQDERQSAVLHYLADSKRTFNDDYERRDKMLPEQMRQFRAYVRADDWQIDKESLPDAPFELLLGLPDLSKMAWRHIAQRATWQQTRANINTFQRHGVFEDTELTQLIALKLRNRTLIEKAKVLPYQLLAAAAMTRHSAPQPIAEALGAAVMIATHNIEAYGGNVVICPDCSLSMNEPVSGQRDSATTKVQCRDAAALITYALKQRNPTAVILPFTTEVFAHHTITAETSLTQIAEKFHQISGGTSVSAPLAWINQYHARTVDLVVIISDNESWKETYEASPTGLASGLRLPSHTATMQQWDVLKARNPRAKLVVIDLAPNLTLQVYERDDVLHIGGWSDAAWGLIGQFVRGETDHGRWVDAVETSVLL